jgi:hypothetical protein
MYLHIIFVVWLYWILNTNNDLLSFNMLSLKVVSGFIVFFLKVTLV